MIELPPDAVHLWWADLDAADAAHAARLLAPDERERMARFVHEPARRRFAARHALLREVVAAYVGADPAAVELVTLAGGKPVAPAAPWLGFNCSSSGPVAVVAVARDRRVGVDVEYRPDGRWDPFPEVRYLFDEERALLPDGEQRAAAAAVAWVVKEAVAKAVGTGLSLDPRELLLGDDLMRPRIGFTGAWTPHAGDWRAEVVARDATRVAAVATDRGWDRIEWRHVR